jgi:fructuronate reductase
MMQRLSRRVLAGLPQQVAQPRYDLDAVAVGVVHLGIGAFHRAHQAVYLDDRLAAGETGWAICAASLRSPTTYDALAPQDNLYTVLERSGGPDRARVIGSVRRLLTVSGDPEPLLAAMCDPRVRIVSLTVTEKGYCHDPATGTLREDDPGIVRDLSAPERPATAPGILVEAIRRRRAGGAVPFTVLCCDNLPSNGETVRNVVTRLAELRDQNLGRFVGGEIAFPSTMVDRIVPATTDADRDATAQLLGATDAWPVVTEPFSQWVVEDRFASGRPRLEECGVQMVADVRPYETMKLRLLNGAHSAMAYLGYLAGYETIAEVITDTAFARFVRALWSEITPTLTVPPDADVQRYQDALFERFANPGLRHRTWQIAMDGSQKLPQRLLETVRHRMRANAPFPGLALAVAAWMRYASGVDEKGSPIDVRDPLAARFAEIAKPPGPSSENLADGFLSLEAVFGTDLPHDPRFRSAVREALASLHRDGAQATVQSFAAASA